MADRRPTDPIQVPRTLRVLEALAGLLSAGVLISGAVLGVLAVLAPLLIGGSGLAATQGPRLDRILVPLLVGAGAETARRLRARWLLPVRSVVAAAVVLICLLALWWGWWR